MCADTEQKRQYLDASLAAILHGYKPVLEDFRVSCIGHISHRKRSSLCIFYIAQDSSLATLEREREREQSHNSSFLQSQVDSYYYYYHGLLSICCLHVSFRPSTPPCSYHDLDSSVDKVDLNTDTVDDYARSLCPKEGSICKIMCGCSTLYLPTYI